MSLIEREYMSDKYRNTDNKSKKKKSQDELWQLYAKKNKTLLDRWKIKRIERRNKKSST